jgi:hypothetical protein
MERKELGQKAGFPESYISKGIARKSCPSAELALKIADALNVPIEKLVTGTDRKASSKDSISPDIRAMITKMNKFSPEQKKVIFDMVDVLAKK